MYIDKHIVFKSNLSEHNLGSLWAQSKKDNCQMHKDESRQEDVFFFTVVKVTYEFCLLKITCTCTFPLIIINRQQVYNEGKGFTKSMFDKKWYFLLGSYSPKLYPAKRVCGTYCICNLFEKIADIEKFRYIYLSISANAQTNNW